MVIRWSYQLLKEITLKFNGLENLLAVHWSDFFFEILFESLYNDLIRIRISRESVGVNIQNRRTHIVQNIKEDEEKIVSGYGKAGKRIWRQSYKREHNNNNHEMETKGRIE